MVMKEVKYKDLGETVLVKALGYSPKLRILDFFLDNVLIDFTKEEVIRELGMSKQTFYRNFKDIEELGIVKQTRKIGKAKLYKINLENPLVKMLKEYENQLSLQIAEQEKEKTKKLVAVEIKR